MPSANVLLLKAPMTSDPVLPFASDDLFSSAPSAASVSVSRTWPLRRHLSFPTLILVLFGTTALCALGIGVACASRLPLMSGVEEVLTIPAVLLAFGAGWLCRNASERSRSGTRGKTVVHACSRGLLPPPKAAPCETVPVASASASASASAPLQCQAMPRCALGPAPLLSSTAGIEGASAASVQRQGMRVLLAGNDRTVLAFLKAALEREAHECQHVDDGETALERLSTDVFDLAILQIGLRGMCGIEVARAFRYMERTPDHAFLMLFGAEAEKAAMQRGCAARTEVEGVFALPADYQSPAVEAAFLQAVAKTRLPQRRHGTPLEAMAISDDLDLAGAFTVQSMGAPDHDAQSRCHATHQADPAVPSLDEAALDDLKDISTDPSFFDALIRGFFDDAQRLLDRLYAALQAGRMEEARQLLHSLKGAAASVGAYGLKERCAHYQRLPAPQLVAESASVTEVLDGCLARYANALRLWRRRAICQAG